MNDTLLSGLLNLFALFGTQNNTDRQRSLEILSGYLARHFGVRKIDDYLPLYSDLRDYYDESPDLDKDVIIENICSKLLHKIRKEEQILMLLRFMEFCDPTPGTEEGKSISAENLAIFRKVADLFNIPGNIFEDFVCYVSGKTNANVLTVEHEGLDGELRTILLRDFNKLLFSYNGPETVTMDDIPVLHGAFMVWQQSSVLKSRYSSPVYYSSILSLYGGSGKKDMTVLAGRNIEFSFRNSSNGIHGMSFTLQSGQLVAIMGSSGTGKTTLLSILNGSIRPQQGSVTVNGHDISEKGARDIIGFVPQDDLLIEELTVYENLFYAAKLCFRGISDEEAGARVSGLLAELGLEGTRDLRVGSPINKVISGGQRKRVNIALELLRDPGIIFIDEPTSGLSSSDSETVMNLLKEQTYKGKLIIVNIHQPSSDIFKLFDRLWILDKGGYPVYDGNPIEAITYFKKAANYADAEISACSLCGNVNPEIILNILDEKVLDDSGHITSIRKVTPREWHRKYLESNTEADRPAVVEDLPGSGQRKPSAAAQCLLFLKRNIRTKMADVQYLFITLLSAPFLAAVVSLLTRYTPPGETYSLMENKNFVSYLFMSVIVAIFTGMIASAEEIFKDRALLKREKFVGLSRSSYLWSKIIFVAGVSAAQTFLYTVTGNIIMGINGMFLIYWTILFLSSFLSSLTGLVLSQTLKSIVSIYITIPLLLIPQILLCGLVVKFEDLTPDSRTGNVPVAGDLIPSRWAFEALAVSSFADNSYESMIFDWEKEKFSTQYYRDVHLDEVQGRLETLRDDLENGIPLSAEDIGIVREGLNLVSGIYMLPLPEQAAGLSPATFTFETYGILDRFIGNAADLLSDYGHKCNMAIDRIISTYAGEHGMDKLLSLRKHSCNRFLEETVAGPYSGKLCRISGTHILPQAGYIYLPPQSHNGRAPFYSSVKYLGDTPVPTLWFNCCIMLIMCMFIIIMIFYDIPKRLLRKFPYFC